MLEITGKCCGDIEAIDFMEGLTDVIPENVKTEEFCEEYEAVLNTFRHSIAKEIGKKKKIIKAKNKKYHNFEYCGKCGFSAGRVEYKYCPNCGTRYK